MKRIFVVFLALCLMVQAVWVLQVFAEEEEKNLFLLWDIPFDITPDECVEMMRDKVGLEMEYKRFSVRYVGEREITLFGRAIDISAFLGDSNEDISSIEIYFLVDNEEIDRISRSRHIIPFSDLDSQNEAAQYLSNIYMDIYEGLEKKYGRQTDGTVYAIDHIDGVDEIIQLDFPLVDGRYDSGLFGLLLHDYIGVEVNSYFRNIRVMYSAIRYSEPENHIVADISIQFNNDYIEPDEDWHIVKNENGDDESEVEIETMDSIDLDL